MRLAFAFGAGALLAMALGAPGMAEAAPSPVESLAGSYAVARDGAEVAGCTVDLTLTPSGRAGRRIVRAALVAPACRKPLPGLAAATGWVWPGGGSVTLFGGKPLREAAHFSPVQDGTGVYLRGGVAGQSGPIELRLRER